MGEKMVIDNRKLYYGILVLIFGPLFIRFFTENFKMSYAIMPFFDVLCFVLVTLAIIINHKKIKINFLFFLVIFSLICQLVSLCINGTSGLYNISLSIRPFYRATFALLLGYLVLNQEDVRNIIKYIEWLLIVNCFVMTFQYFVLGIDQDIIGGTFGNSQGVNTIQNILCCSVLIYEVLSFLNKKASFKKLALITLMDIYICALAEITVFFAEIVLIYILAFLLDKSSISFLKKIFLILFGIIFLALGIKLYLIVFPDRAFLLSYNNALDYLGFNVNAGNTGVYKISRIYPFKQLANMFFNSNILKLFGLGLGNCSTGSPFYMANDATLHYDWFSSAMIFLENGYFGVLFYLLVALYLFIKACIKSHGETDPTELLWINFVRISIIIDFILFFYNDSLRTTYTAYTIGILLSVAFLAKKGTAK